MTICPGCTFDGFENNNQDKTKFEEKVKILITNGEENPDPRRKILVQR